MTCLSLSTLTEEPVHPERSRGARLPSPLEMNGIQLIRTTVTRY